MALRFSTEFGLLETGCFSFESQVEASRVRYFIDHALSWPRHDRALLLKVKTNMIA